MHINIICRDDTLSACIVSQFGLAIRRSAGMQKGLGSVPFLLSFLFKSCGLWTLSSDCVPHN